VRQCIPRGFSGKGPKGFGLPPRRTLFFDDRLRRSRGWFCREWLWPRSGGGLVL